MCIASAGSITFRRGDWRWGHWWRYWSWRWRGRPSAMRLPTFLSLPPACDSTGSSSSFTHLPISLRPDSSGHCCSGGRSCCSSCRCCLIRHQSLSRSSMHRTAMAVAVASSTAPTQQLRWSRIPTNRATRSPSSTLTYAPVVVFARAPARPRPLSAARRHWLRESTCRSCQLACCAEVSRKKSVGSKEQPESSFSAVIAVPTSSQLKAPILP